MRELVAASVAKALETVLAAAVGDKVQCEWWRQREKLIVAEVLAELEQTSGASPTDAPTAVLPSGAPAALPWLEWMRGAPTTRVSVTLSEAQELIAAGVLAELELLRGAQRATDSAALVSPPTVPSVVPPSMTGIGVGSGTLGTMTTLDGVI